MLNFRQMYNPQSFVYYMLLLEYKLYVYRDNYDCCWGKDHLIVIKFVWLIF